LTDTVNFQVELYADLSEFGNAKVFGLVVSEGEDGFPPGLYVTSGPAPDDRADRMFRIIGPGQVELVKDGFHSNFQMVFANGPYGEGILVTEPLEQRILRLQADGSVTVFAYEFTPPFGPSALLYDAEGGMLLTCDQSSGRILSVMPNGFSTLFCYIPPDGSFGPTSVAVDMNHLYGGEYVVATFCAPSVNPGTSALYSVSADGQYITQLTGGLNSLELLTFGPGGKFGTELFVSTMGGDTTGDGAVYILHQDLTLAPFLLGLDATCVVFDASLAMYAADIAEADRSDRTRSNAGRIWKITEKTTGLDDPGAVTAVAETGLYPNLPNPCSESTDITYYLPLPSQVMLEVYDLAGRRSEVLLNRHEAAGKHKVTWEAARYPEGVYFCRMSACDRVEVIRMVVIR
jgi:hypothetical protein